MLFAVDMLDVHQQDVRDLHQLLKPAEPIRIPAERFSGSIDACMDPSFLCFCKQVDQEVEQAFQQIQEDYKQQERIAKAELERKRQEAETESEVQQAEAQFHTDMEDALKSFVDTARETVQKTIDEKPQELVERVEKAKQEQEKRTVEDEVRAHLRGFARTIPSFIMAYGDENLTLANFDDHTEDDVFLEVTGITEEQFRFLRDGAFQWTPV